MAGVQEKKKKPLHLLGKKSGASLLATSGKQASSNLTHFEQGRVVSCLCFTTRTLEPRPPRGSLQLGGKLESPGQLNAIAPGFLVQILDQIFVMHFLVDIGAAFSILPYF
jgi:hypothetical protein